MHAVNAHAMFLCCGRAGVNGMRRPHVDMAPNGRLVIPAKIRSELGISGGATFVVEVEEGVIKLVPFDLVIQRIQDEVRRYVPEGTDLVAELLEDRRREAEAELD